MTKKKRKGKRVKKWHCALRANSKLLSRGCVDILYTAAGALTSCMQLGAECGELISTQRERVITIAQLLTSFIGNFPKKNIGKFP